MKNYFLYLLLIITCISSAQNVSISIDRKPSLVQGIANPISIIGKNCNDYVLTTDNGKFEQSSSDGKFTVYPNHTGLAKISIIKKSGKLIKEENYNVKPVEFSMEIAGFKKFISDINHFNKFARFNLHSDDLDCLDFDWSANFELIIIAENKTTEILSHSKNGSLNESKEYFKTLKQGNLIMFHNIKVTAGATEFKVADIVLEVN